MDFKKLFMLIFFVFVLSLFVFAVDQEVTVDILTVPSIFLGNNSGGDNEVDTDGTVFATLGNNGAAFCEINWETGFVNIHPAINSTNNTYSSVGEKIVQYRCRALNHEFVTVNDTIEVTRVPPLITLIEPVLNYNTKKVPIDVLINKGLINLQYSVDGGRLGSLCRNCDSYNKTKIFKDGYHNLTLIATDKFRELGRNVTRFFVDATAPKIKETLPKKKDYTNGSFSIEYDEELLHNITLNYNGSSTKLDCPSGKKQICYFYVDLSEHNNDTINYYFEVRDMFFKTVQRKPFAVKVDTVVPEITKLNFTVDRRRVEFDVEISEEVDLLYYDLNSTRPRWISLCRNCDGYNKKKSFRTGEHNLIIMASDKASNSDQEMISFFI